MKGHDPIERLNQLLKARLETWMLLDKTRQPQLEPLVTITQEPGCGAESIAEKLCSELGLHLYDWELVEQIAQDQQRPFFADYIERPRHRTIFLAIAVCHDR
jgi:hypothetical protein